MPYEAQAAARAAFMARQNDTYRQDPFDRLPQSTWAPEPRRYTQPSANHYDNARRTAGKK
jgi:hypothetical protein